MRTEVGRAATTQAIVWAWMTRCTRLWGEGKECGCGPCRQLEPQPAAGRVRMGQRSSRSRLAHQAPTGARTAVCWPILLQTAETSPEWRAFLPALARPPSAARPCPPARPRAPRCENAVHGRSERWQHGPGGAVGVPAPHPSAHLPFCTPPALPSTRCLSLDAAGRPPHHRGRCHRPGAVVSVCAAGGAA